MSMTRRLAQFEQGRELPGKPMAKGIEPSKKEEVVPWLWDFAYLYKPGGLNNLDDGKSKDSEVNVQKQKAAEVGILTDWNDHTCADHYTRPRSRPQIIRSSPGRQVSPAVSGQYRTSRCIPSSEMCLHV